MFITGGRAGQAMFFLSMAILIFQYFKGQRIKSIIVILILIPGIFFTAYQTSSFFANRIDRAIYEIVNYDKRVVAYYHQSSLGTRILFTANSWEIIKENPLLGAGTGDFPHEYKKVNQINSPGASDANNPHNMYILVLTQLGIVGLLSMLSIFYYQIKLSFTGSDRYFRDLRITLPLLFLLIMLSDSYLLGHYTSLLFIFFSSFIYKGFD